MSGDEWRKETDKLHDRITEVGNKVVKTNLTVEGIKGQLNGIGIQLGHIHKEIKNGQAVKAGDRRGMFAIITALIASLTALVRSFWQ